jgi:hypothetical protein
MGECGVYSQWVWGKYILLKALSLESAGYRDKQGVRFPLESAFAGKRGYSIEEGIRFPL